MKRTWNILVVFSILFFYQTSELYANSIVRQYNKANSYMSMGRLPEAEKTLKRIIKKYPDHKPSYLLLGRLYYRQGRLSKAIRYFKRSDLGMMDVQTLFEYGLSLYTFKYYKKAIKVFKRIPARDPLKGYARFYAGVSYLKRQQYSRSYIKLQKARGLPRSLDVERRKLLRVARTRMSSENTGRVYRYAPMVLVPAPVPLGWKPLPKEPGEGKPKIGEVSPFSLQSTLGLSYAIVSTTDTHDTGRNKTADKTTLTGSAGAAAKYAEGEGPSFTLGLNADESLTKKSSKDVVFTRVSEDSNEVASEEIIPPEEKGKSLILKASPGLSFPLGEELDLSMSYIYQEVWPSLDRELVNGFSIASGIVGMNLDDLNVDLTGSYKDDFTAEGSSKVTTSFKLSLSILVDGFNLSASSTYTMFESATENPLTKDAEMSFNAQVSRKIQMLALTLDFNSKELTPAADNEILNGSALSTYSTSLSANVSMDFGITISARGAYDILYTYGRTNIETNEKDEEDKPVTIPMFADASAFSGSGTIKVAPVNWAFVSYTYNVKSIAYEINDTQYEANFYQAVPTGTSSSAITFGLSQSF